jgi:hypothetical protein
VAFTERHEVEAIDAVELGENRMGGCASAWCVVLRVGGSSADPDDRKGRARWGFARVLRAVPNDAEGVRATLGLGGVCRLLATIDAAGLSGDGKDPSKVRRVERGGESWGV